MNEEQLTVNQLLVKHKKAKTLEEQTPIKNEILNRLENLGYDMSEDDNLRIWHYICINHLWENSFKYGRKEPRKNNKELLSNKMLLSLQPKK